VTEASQKLLIIGTHAEENPDKATLPFVLGSSALAMGTDVIVILQSTGVYLAMKGYADHVHASGFPPLAEMLETFFDAGGKLMVCSPCLMARKIDPSDLIPNAEVVAGATLVAEALESDSTITY
jgi:uncharacterized protein involved in oxidation of intracellular sulfur